MTSTAIATGVARSSSATAALRRSASTIVPAFLLGALALTIPWTLFVMTLGEALSKGWPDAEAGKPFVIIIDESLAGAQFGGALAVVLLAVIAVVSGLVAAKRKQATSLVVTVVTVALIVVFALTAALALA